VARVFSFVGFVSSSVDLLGSVTRVIYFVRRMVGKCVVRKTVAWICLRNV
jgi:hypothetical protein